MSSLTGESLSLSVLKNWLIHYRLVACVLGSLAMHAIFFGFGYWDQHLWIPSKEDRIMVVNIDNALFDGVNERTRKAVDTLNDASLSQHAQSATSDASTVSDEITSKRTNKSNIDDTDNNVAAVRTASTNHREQATEPIPEVSYEFQPEPSLNANSAKSAATSERVSEQVTDIPDSLQSRSLIEENQQQASSVFNQETSSDVPGLLTSTNSEYLIQTTPPAPQLNSAPFDQSKGQKNQRLPSSRQQKLLERKLTSWAKKLSKDVIAPESLNWEIRGQSYAVNLKQQPADNEMEMDELLAEVITEHDGQQLTIKIRMKKLAFSNFAQFVHHWDPNVSIHNDEMDGRFHSNSSINIASSKGVLPTFHSKVTTASSRVNYEGRSRRKTVFLGGLETGVKRILMPKPSHLFKHPPNDEDSNTVFFDENTRIIFTKDGDYLWSTIGQHGPMQRGKLTKKANYLMAVAGKTLYLSGQVKGQLLVYSPKRIVIEADLVYAEHVTNSLHTSLLGLVSGGNIEIANDDIIPPGDLNIHGAIYAKQRFLVKKFSAKRTGTLSVFGSITAGSIGASEPRYDTKIIFDKRLESLRPPSFPVSDHYDITSTEFNWTPQSHPSLQAPPY